MGRLKQTQTFILCTRYLTSKNLDCQAEQAKEEEKVNQILKKYHSPSYSYSVNLAFFTMQNDL